VVDTANRRANGESEDSFHATVAVASFPSPTHEEVKKHEAKKLKGKQKSERKKTAKGSTAKCIDPSKGKGATTKRRGGKT
jgi:hypothetical protein